MISLKSPKGYPHCSKVIVRDLLNGTDYSHLKFWTVIRKMTDWLLKSILSPLPGNWTWLHLLSGWLCDWILAKRLSVELTFITSRVNLCNHPHLLFHSVNFRICSMNFNSKAPCKPHAAVVKTSISYQPRSLKNCIKLYINIFLFKYKLLKPLLF